MNLTLIWAARVLHSSRQRRERGQLPSTPVHQHKRLSTCNRIVNIPSSSHSLENSSTRQSISRRSQNAIAPLNSVNVTRSGVVFRVGNSKFGPRSSRSSKRYTLTTHLIFSYTFLCSPIWHYELRDTTVQLPLIHRAQYIASARQESQRTERTLLSQTARDTSSVQRQLESPGSYNLAVAQVLLGYTLKTKRAMSIPTPPATTLSQPPSPTELQLSNLTLDEEETDMLPHSAKRITKTVTTIIAPIFMRPKPIYIIVATSLNPPMGIGHKGKLPWPGIKADMAFFRSITAHVPKPSGPESAPTNPKPLNAVVMGRKTWESIPLKFRPLAGRLNVIITRSDSQKLGYKILQELKSPTNGADAATGWEIHTIPSPKARSTSKSKRSAQGPSTLLAPAVSTFALSNENAVSPILISPSLPALLSLLSSASLIQIPSANASSSPSSSTNPSDPTLSLSINKIFCIGGAEIYQRVLSLSSHSPQIPATPTGAGTGSDTGTDNEAEFLSDKHTGAEGDQFDVRILQTQIRRPPIQTSSTSNQSQSQDRRQSKVEVDFECDTFFPDLLPGPGSSVKSAKWRPVPQSKLFDWVEPAELPQYLGRRKQSVENALDPGVEEAEEAQNGKEMWFGDEKAGVEIRVVGWERR